MQAWYQKAAPTFETINQIDKTTANSNKQQIIIKQLAVQVKAMQKQLDKIGSSSVSSKTFQISKGKNLITNARRNKLLKNDIIAYGHPD